MLSAALKSQSVPLVSVKLDNFTTKPTSIIELFEGISTHSFSSLKSLNISNIGLDSQLLCIIWNHMWPKIEWETHAPKQHSKPKRSNSGEMDLAPLTRSNTSPALIKESQSTPNLKDAAFLNRSAASWAFIGRPLDAT